MSEIHIHRDHQLGLSAAREVATQWADEAASKFGMSCNQLTGETSDTLEFKRSGANGSLIVAADHFDLRLSLGFLMSGFASTIQAQIEKNLDELLASKAGETGA